MEASEVSSKAAMHITRRCLVVTIQAELADESVLQIQADILQKLSQAGVKGLIIDVSGVNIIDSFLAQEIFDTAKMAFMLGATTVITGIKPEVAASLTDLDFELGDARTALTIEEGFEMLRPIVEPPAPEEADDQADYDEEKEVDSIDEDEESFADDEDADYQGADYANDQEYLSEEVSYNG